MSNDFFTTYQRKFPIVEKQVFNDRVNIKILSALIVCVFAVILSSIGYSNSISNLQKENPNSAYQADISRHSG